MNPKTFLCLAVWPAALLGSGLRAAPPPAAATDLSPAAVLALTERVADWQLAHPSAHPPTDWTQGAFYAGVMALAGVADSPRFRDAMVTMGDANAWKLGPRPYNADDHCVGQTYADLYLQRHDPRMIAPMRERFDWILAHPKDNNLDFDTKRNPDALDRWSWCDSLFMAPPAWVRLSAATGDQAYLDFATTQWWVTSDFLYDKDEHLCFRDSSYFARREANGKKIFWSRGNGWVMAGLVRMLQFLPFDHPTRHRFVQQFQEMAEAIRACQQPDGLWRSSLLDPTEYPLRETSGSGFHCYALAWGVNQGLLDRSQFEPVVIKAWQGLTGCVEPDGRLTHVQPIGADPKKFDENSTEVLPGWARSCWPAAKSTAWSDTQPANSHHRSPPPARWAQGEPSRRLVQPLDGCWNSLVFIESMVGHQSRSGAGEADQPNHLSTNGLAVGLSGKKPSIWLDLHRDRPIFGSGFRFLALAYRDDFAQHQGQPFDQPFGSSSMKRPHRRPFGFTLMELALGATILAVGLAGMIEALALGSGMLDTARKQTLAAQVVQAEVEYLRMQNWSTIQNLTSTSAANLSTYTEFASTSLATVADTSVKFSRTLAASDPHPNLRQITMTVTWTSITGKSHSRSCTAYIGKYGLNGSYQRL